MPETLPDTDLVVATPERVSFDYQVAGLGTRAIAQLLDLVIVGVVLLAILVAAFTVGIAGSPTAGLLIGIIGSFVAILATSG